MILCRTSALVCTWSAVYVSQITRRFWNAWRNVVEGGNSGLLGSQESMLEQTRLDSEKWSSTAGSKQSLTTRGSGRVSGKGSFAWRELVGCK